jgi:DNA-binding response OmpR family regulator
MLLRTAEYAPDGVASSEEALAWINRRARDPDVLIVDFELDGDLNGSDVAQEIFRILGRPIPTIILSGHLTEITLPWMPGAPLLCVWKPIHPDILLKAVEVFAEFGGFVRGRSRRGEEQSTVRGG